MSTSATAGLKLIESRGQRRVEGRAAVERVSAAVKGSAFKGFVNGSAVGGSAVKGSAIKGFVKGSAVKGSALKGFVNGSADTGSAGKGSGDLDGSCMPHRIKRSVTSIYDITKALSSAFSREGFSKTPTGISASVAYPPEASSLSEPEPMSLSSLSSPRRASPEDWKAHIVISCMPNYLHTIHAPTIAWLASHTNVAHQTAECRTPGRVRAFCHP